MEIYKRLSNLHKSSYTKYSTQFSILAIIRFMLMSGILIFFWLYLKNTNSLYLAGSVSMVILFLVLLQIHLKIKNKRNIAQKLIEINEDEISYLNHASIPFSDGAAYIDVQHLYTYDLDIFGPSSLFQHLNRTATPTGKNILAAKLSTPLLTRNLPKQQKAIQELSEKIEFRQLFYANAKLAKLDQDAYNKLINWSKIMVTPPNILMKVIRFLMPGLFFLMLGLAYFTENILFTYLANTCFLLNLSVFAFCFKEIKKELIVTEKIHESLLQYSLIFELIYKEEMQAEYLIQLKNELLADGEQLHENLKKLSQLFNQLSSVENPVGAVFFNGALLYHLGVYNNLQQWKKKHALNLEKYLNTLGEFEALNSLANFTFNNQAYAFPTINNDYRINFKAIGHPLINKEKRICNDVTFGKSDFIILTGSNMSGKSTFLRTLGINLVLGNAGAPVCASIAEIHPLPVIVSMRMSDSLTDSESYFFAEVKRLKQMMNELDQQICFVLLDEILKGTNSDDKRMGTIKVIEKMVQKKAIGAIATHDLEVCNITASHPDNLRNNCFEVEIVNNELVFDYKLRPGVCKNKSATFLMNKMEII